MLRKALFLLLAGSAPLHAQSRQDWPVTTGDPGAQAYSPLADIDRSNVKRLQPAWSWSVGEAPIPGPRLPVGNDPVRAGTFETTPVVINDTMYLSTPYNRVVALDANTGKEHWVYDARAWEWGQPPNGTGLVHRGVAVWSGRGERRIFLNSRWRLIALDAATGKEIDSFGYGGEIDLTENLPWRTIKLHFTQTSPPVIWRDLVIVGNGVGDRLVYRNDPPGVIQAFDVKTGKRAWMFSLVPLAGDPATSTWENESWKEWGHTNAWAPMSVDAERGILYVPVGTPSNDYYGGHRKGDNLYAESIVAIDLRTGKRLWHFQTVHHGLWDFDLSSPPNLLTITVDGRKIDAVAVPAKTGFLYVFDRVTGKPVWPIEERPVPQSDVPGEQTSPTQPFPTKPAPFAKVGFTEEDLIDFTPEIKAKALEAIQGLRYGSPFMPPSLQGSLILPGIIGGANWGGAAVDPRSATIFVKATNQVSLLKVAPGDPKTLEGDYGVDRSRRSVSVEGLPLNKPPYGTLTAIDLNTGEHRWQVPIGDMPEMRRHKLLEGVKLPERLGAYGAPGPIVTAGGLVFVSGGSTSLYAVDASTGEVLWEAPLGMRSNANPMTYRTRAGRQFVVIATGNGENGKLLTFALPERVTQDKETPR